MWLYLCMFLSAPSPTFHPNVTKKFLDGLLQAPTPPPSIYCDIPLPLSVTTLYLAGLTGIFIVTAFMHLPEAYCLLHGAWYLLCLPAGNLFLMIYSICNITDRSWGLYFPYGSPGFESGSSRNRIWYRDFYSALRKISRWKHDIHRCSVNKNR